MRRPADGPRDGGSALRFATPIGPVFFRWTEIGLSSVRLPGPSDPAAVPEDTFRGPDWVARAMEEVRELLMGERRDLCWVPLDLRGVPDFHRRVYDHIRTIPPGQAQTYGEVARAIGQPEAAQAVGQALGRNPVPIVAPCHRVLAASGRTGGFSAPGGARTKLKLLAIEGYHGPGPTLFDPRPAAPATI